MQTTMTSRERLRAAMSLEETDHLPLWCLWSHGRDPFNRRDQLVRIPATLELGFDDTLWLDGPWRVHPDVREVAWTEPAPGESYTLLHKRYETPAGNLEWLLRSSQYKDSAEGIGVVGDLNMSHAMGSLVRSSEDLPALRYLLSDPDAEQLARFGDYARTCREAAATHQVLLEGAYVALGDVLAWLVRPQDLIYAQQDDPGFVEELLDLVWQWTQRQICYHLDQQVDVILHRGWYDIPDFWGVKGYRRFLKPYMEREARLVHEAGARFSYIMTKGIMPLLGDFLDIGLDLLWGVDPVQGEADLDGVAATLGGRMCVLGGMNGNLTMAEGSPDDVRAAVDRAVDALGGGRGFILSPVDQLEEGVPWENVEALLERWRERA